MDRTGVLSCTHIHNSDSTQWIPLTKSARIQVVLPLPPIFVKTKGSHSPTHTARQPRRGVGGGRRAAGRRDEGGGGRGSSAAEGGKMHDEQKVGRRRSCSCSGSSTHAQAQRPCCVPDGLAYAQRTLQRTSCICSLAVGVGSFCWGSGSGRRAAGGRWCAYSGWCK